MNKLTYKKKEIITNHSRELDVFVFTFRLIIIVCVCVFS